MHTPFLRDESGAVTVDWVVLTAALVGLGLAVMGVVSSGAGDLAGDVDAHLKGDIISTSFSTPPDRLSMASNGWISPSHSDAWQADMTARYNDPDQYSTETLVDMYGTYTDQLAAEDAGDLGNDQWRNALDHTGLIEDAIVNRGEALPDTATDYTTAYGRYEEIYGT